MNKDLNLEREEDDYNEAREKEIKKIAEFKGITDEAAEQEWENLKNSCNLKESF